MKKVKEFISMVNKDNDPRFNSHAFYFLTDKGEDYYNRLSKYIGEKKMNEYEKMSKDELLTRCMFLEEVLKERDEQIEKMKCFVNCKHWAKGNCSLDDNYCICNKWELAD